MEKDNLYDLIIVGAGPAGYAAAIYARRYKLETLVIGPLPGGQISEAHKVCNFPGYPEISGLELGLKMQEHAKKLGTQERPDKVVSIGKENDFFVVKTEKSGEFTSKSLLLAYGTERKKLDIPNEEKYAGKGVFYCATCDGYLFSDQIVAVVGGSNAATTATLLLSDIAKKVYLIYRGDELKGDQVWVEQVRNKENIEVLLKSKVTKLMGETILTSIGLENDKELPVKALFVEIGSKPNTELIENLNIYKDEKGYIQVNLDQSTNIEGIYAAGDITTNSNGFRQVITASSEGAIAANSIYKFLRS